MDMSGDRPSRRFDVVAESRRRWSRAEKLAIVAEASSPCTNVSAVARRHGIKPALLFRWKRESRAAEEASSAASFMPVVVSGPRESVPATITAPSNGHEPGAKPSGSVRGDNIEIELENRRRIRIGAGVDVSVLKRVIDLLEA